MIKSVGLGLLLAAMVGITLPVPAARAEGPVDGVGYRQPVTYTSVQDSNRIAIQITEGEFQFHGILQRTMDSNYVGSNGRVRVMYNRSTGRVVVINEVTGTEFYNYTYQPRSDEYRPATGEDPNTMCDPRREPC